MALSAAATTPMTALIAQRRWAIVGPDGRFSVSGLAPGQYMVTARAASAGAKPMAGGRGGSSPPVMDFWAVADLNVMGLDVSGVVLRLAPGMRVSGRIAVEATTETPPADLSRVQIRLVVAAGQRDELRRWPLVRRTQMERSASSGVAPGQYYFTANLIGGTPTRPTWTLKSATVNGRDVLDTPLDVRPGEDITNVAVAFTDRVTSLAGSLTNRSGRPAPGYFVMAFPANTMHWRQQSRWLRSPTRPASDGRFSVVGLPPGEYHLAAITEFAPNEWYTPAFLQQLVPLSLKFTLSEGQEHRQDIRLAGK